MIKLINVSKKYKRKKLFSNFNLSINNYGIYSFIGDNGSGKTTLLNIMIKFVKPTKGKVINNFKKISFISQNINLVNHLTIEEHFFMFNIDVKLLNKVKLYSKRNSYPFQLSYGQKQRVFSMLAIYCSSNLLLADEPTSHLDSKNSLILMKEIFKVSKNKTVLLVSHDAELINKFSDAIYRVGDNKVTVIKNNVGKKEKNENVNKQRVKLKKYIRKSLCFYKKINFCFLLLFFLIFLILFGSLMFESNVDTVIKNSINYSLDYNKFYLKECSNENNLIKKCHNLTAEKIKVLKDSGNKVGYNYDLLLNSLYESDKFNIVHKEDYVIKEGVYPNNFNEILANDTHKIGEMIKLTSTKVINENKVDIYNQDLSLKVVGIIENNVLMKKDNYYLDYDLVEEYFKNQYLINNKVSLYDYFENTTLNDYKYVIYFENINLDILKENEIDYLSSSYDYFENIFLIIEEINKCLIYVNIIVFIVSFYYIVRMLMKKINSKNEDLLFLKAMGFKNKKIIKIFCKEQNFIMIVSAFLSVVIISIVLWCVLKKVYIDYVFIFSIICLFIFLNKIITSLMINKRIKLC